MAQAAGVTKMTVNRDINILKKKGAVTRVGPAKGGHWKLKKGKSE